MIPIAPTTLSNGFREKLPIPQSQKNKNKQIYPLQPPTRALVKGAEKTLLIYFLKTETMLRNTTLKTPV